MSTALLVGCEASIPSAKPAAKLPAEQPPERAGWLDEAAALTILPRSTEAVVVAKSLRWVTETIAWSSVGPRLVGADEGDAGHALGIDASDLASEAWTAAGIDLDAPLVAALLDARTETGAIVVGVADRDRLLAAIQRAASRLGRTWIAAERGEAVLVRDETDERLSIVVRGGAVALVGGGDTFRVAEQLATAPPGSSLAHDRRFSAFAASLPAHVQAVAYADVAGLLDDLRTDRAGPRHPILGSLSVAGLGLWIEGGDIVFRGEIDLEEGSLPARVLRADGAQSADLDALAAAPLGVAARLAPETLGELATALWMFSRLPEDSEATWEQELGADVQAAVLPRLSGEVVALARSEPTPDAAKGPSRFVAEVTLGARDRASLDALIAGLSSAPLTSPTEPDRWFARAEGARLVLSSAEPGSLGVGSDVGIGSALAPRAKAFLTAHDRAPLCAVVDAATVGYLDAPFHYASLELPSDAPPAKGEPKTAAYRAKRAEVIAVEREALAAWRAAEEIDMRFVLSSLARLGRVVACAEPARRGLSIEGRVLLAEESPTAVVTAWLGLRDEQRGALSDMMKRLEELEQRRWRLREELRRLAE